MCGGTPATTPILAPNDPHLQPDLVVFNAPWVPENEEPMDAGYSVLLSRRGTGAAASPLKQQQDVGSMAAGDWLHYASYRPQSLLEEFFQQAHELLAPGGRVLMLYSNYANLVGREPEVW